MSPWMLRMKTLHWGENDPENAKNDPKNANPKSQIPKSQIPNLKSQISNLKSQILKDFDWSSSSGRVEKYILQKSMMYLMNAKNDPKNAKIL